MGSPIIFGIMPHGALIGIVSLLVLARPESFAAMGTAGVNDRVAAASQAGARPMAASATADRLLDLDSFRGKVVYLDFWASWCAPCGESFPWMNSIQQEFGADGLVIIAVDVDRERADGERFIRELPPQFRIVFDPEGMLPEKFGVQVMPTTFLIDRNGRVRLRHEGFQLKDRDSMVRQIRSILAAH